MIPAQVANGACRSRSARGVLRRQVAQRIVHIDRSAGPARHRLHHPLAHAVIEIVISIAAAARTAVLVLDLATLRILCQRRAAQRQLVSI